MIGPRSQRGGPRWQHISSSAGGLLVCLPETCDLSIVFDGWSCMSTKPRKSYCSRCDNTHVNLQRRPPCPQVSRKWGKKVSHPLELSFIVCLQPKNVQTQCQTKPILSLLSCCCVSVHSERLSHHWTLCVEMHGEARLYCFRG